MANISIEEFYKMLEQFDWFYAMSDDHSVYTAGRIQRERIAAIAEANGRNFQRLFRDYQKHVYSGRPWDTEKAPLPEVKDYADTRESKS